MATRIILIALLFISISCTPGKLDPVSYEKYIKNPAHGLYVEKEIGDYRFCLQYKPVEYVALIDTRGNDTPHPSLIVAEYENLEHYTFIIKRIDGKSVLKGNGNELNDFYDLINYFSFGIQEEITLMKGTDTFPCKISHFERTYELTPSVTLLLGFENDPKRPNKEDRTFLYKDKMLGTGTIKIKIKGKKIKNAPGIKI